MMQLNEPLAISHSSLQMFTSCPRKLEFRKFYRSGGKDRSLDADVGNAMHAGYQEFLVSKNRDKAIATMMLEYPIDLNHNGPMNYRSMEACLPSLEALMDAGSMVEFEIAQVEGLDGELHPAIEVPFHLKIKNFKLHDGTEVVYVGFIDAIFYDRLNDVYVVVDVKTHRDNSNDLSPKFIYSDQCMPYAIVLERMLGQPIDKLTVKYLTVYIDIINPKVMVYSFEKSSADVEDWARGYLIQLEQIKMFYKMGWFPRRGGDVCLAWKRACVFMDLCGSRDATQIKAIIDHDAQEFYTREKEPWIKLEMDLGVAA